MNFKNLDFCLYFKLFNVWCVVEFLFFVMLDELQ